MPALFCLIRMILMSVFPFESPEYSYKTGNKDKAQQFIKHFYKPEYWEEISDYYVQKNSTVVSH